MAMPGSPVSLPHASAICTAAASWRTCTRSIGRPSAASKRLMMWLPDRVEHAGYALPFEGADDDVGPAQCFGHVPIAPPVATPARQLCAALRVPRQLPWPAIRTSSVLRQICIPPKARAARRSVVFPSGSGLGPANVRGDGGQTATAGACLSSSWDSGTLELGKDHRSHTIVGVLDVAAGTAGAATCSRAVCGVWPEAAC
jgi:hypothetical protein